MKHPVRDRLIIIICFLGILAIAASIGLVGLDMISVESLSSAITQMQSSTSFKVVSCIVAVVLVVFALVVLAIALPGRKKRTAPFAIVNNEAGAVNISVKALENLVQKCLKSHPELNIVSSSIFSEGEEVRISMHITLYEDISIPLAVSALQKEIKQYLQACAGVEVSDVRVFVDGTVSMTDQSVVSPYRVAGSLLPENAAASNTVAEATETEAKPSFDQPSSIPEMQSSVFSESPVSVQAEEPITIVLPTQEDKEEPSDILVTPEEESEAIITPEGELDETTTSEETEKADETIITSSSNDELW